MKSLVIDLVKKAQKKACFIQIKLLVAQTRQEYMDCKVRDMSFKSGEQVLLKVSPI